MKKEVSKKIDRKWHLLDANDKYLGRFVSQAVTLLRGKNKVSFAPYLDNGDYVVIVNADKLKVTANKAMTKMYYHFSGYSGGIKKTNFRDLQAKDPAKIIKLAVWGMLPKNKLRPQMMKRLKIFSGDKHPYQEKLK